MDDERRERFELYCSHIASWPERGKDIQQQLESFNESYQGYFSGSCAKENLAYQFVEDTDLITDANPTVRGYFDYSAFARDLFMDGYTEIDGHVFIDY